MTTTIEDSCSEPPTADGIVHFIRHALAAEMNVLPESLATDQSLIHSGVDSMAAMALCNRLEDRLGASLTISEVLCGNSIDDLAVSILALIQAGSSHVRTRIAGRANSQPIER
jgi:acyl carrier protein